MNSNSDDKKLDWMYKGPNNLVDREEYLLGRSVDKTLEQLNAEEKEKKLGLVPPKNHVEHECIPPSIRDFNKIVQAEQVDLSAKLQEDPLVAIKKREEEARRQFLQNPVQLKKLQEALKAQEVQKKKKKKHKSKSSDSDSDLDNKIVKKLKYLKDSSTKLITSKKSKTKSKDDVLDTILMHKFNELKDKLSQEDLNDILAGNVSDSDEEAKSKRKKKKARSPSSDGSSDKRNKKINSKKNVKQRNRSSSREKSKISRKKRNSSSSSSSNESSDDKNRSKNRNKIDKTQMVSQHKKESEHKPKTINRDISRDVSVDRFHKSKDYTSKNKDKYEYRPSNERLESRKERYNESDRPLSSKKEHYEKKIEDADSELESKILKKLRMLRDSVPTSEGQDNDRENYSRKETAKIVNKNITESLSNESSDENTPQIHSRYDDSESDPERNKPRAFGLVKSDGTKLTLNKTKSNISQVVTTPAKDEIVSKPAKKNVKKLSEEEKEKLRREMMKDAVKRDRERSDNLKRYREEDKKEEKQTSKFNKDFMHKELLKTTKDATVETRIKSNLNNIQRSSVHMDSHFSRRK